MTLNVERLHEHWPDVFHYVRRRMQGVDFVVIEDLAADVFERAIRKANTYHERGTGPRNWLLTIAERTVINWRRSGNPRFDVDLDEVDWSRWRVDAGSEQHVAVLDLRAAMALLSPDVRHVLWRQAEGVPQQDAGAEIGLKKTASFRRDREGREALRAALAGGMTRAAAARVARRVVGDARLLAALAGMGENDER